MFDDELNKMGPVARSGQGLHQSVASKVRAGYMGKPLEALNDPWDGLQQMIAERGSKLDQWPLQPAKYREALDGFVHWIDEGPAALLQGVEITDHAKTVAPVQQPALGLHHHSAKSTNDEPSAKLQPFPTLQSDIQNSNNTSEGDGLFENFSSEQLDDYNVEIGASRNLSPDQLPPILALHLKLVYLQRKYWRMPRSLLCYA